MAARRYYLDWIIVMEEKLIILLKIDLKVWLVKSCQLNESFRPCGYIEKV